VRLNTNLNLFLALLFGFIVSFLLGSFFYSLETKVITAEFEKDFITESLAIEREIALNFHAIYSLKNFYDNSQHVDSTEFKQFSLTLLQSHPIIQGLSWVPKITQDERQQYDSKAHYFQHRIHIKERNQAQQLEIAQQRDIYFPVTYIEPFSSNKNALGFDLASNPIRLAALNLAKKTNDLAITASLQLVQENGAKKSFLAVLPIYAKQAQPVTTDKQIKGYITAVFHIDDLVRNALDNTAERDIRLSLLDHTTAQKEVLHITHPEIARHEKIHADYALGLVGGRKWLLQASPSENYITHKRSANPFIIFLLLFTFISSSILYIFRLLRQSEITQQAVAARTAELEQARLEMERLSLLDPMTGIANRRHFDNYLMKQWKLGKREQTPLSLLVIDIDYFKQFNDNYGHLAGDECIQRVAQTLKDTVKRPADMLARYGGEEFAIIAPNTSDAYILAELCRQNIEKTAIPHGYSSVSDRITVSIGFTTLIPHDASNPDKLFKQADEALYTAKSAGRNQSIDFKP